MQTAPTQRPRDVVGRDKAPIAVDRARTPLRARRMRSIGTSSMLYPYMTPPWGSRACTPDPHPHPSTTQDIELAFDTSTSDLPCSRTSVTVLNQDIGDTSGGLGGDSSRL